MTTLGTQIVLPSAIEHFTRSFVTRMRHLLLVRAMLRLAVFVIGWSVAWAVVDRFAHLPGWARAVVVGVNLLAVLWVGWRTLRRWHRPDVLWQQAAAEIERRDPRLTDRLQTVVSQSRMHASVRASDALLATLAGDVSDSLAGRDATRLVPLTALVPAGLALLAALGLTGGLALFPYLGLPRLIERQYRPFANLPPVTTTLLTVEPGDVDLAQGSTLTIRVRAVRLGGGLVSLYTGRSAGEVAFSQIMPLDADGAFVVPVKNVDQDLYYRVEGGDARSALYAARVLRKPAVTGMSVKYVYPKYLDRPPLVIAESDGQLDAPRGTTAEVTFTATEPLAAADVVVGDTRIDSRRTIDPNVRSATLEMTQSAPWSISMVSTRSVLGTGPDGLRLTATQDRPPIVQFMREDLRLHPSDVLALPYQAIDDYGIKSLALEVRCGDRVLLQQPVELAGDRRLVREVISYDLAPAALSYGDVVTLTLTATDTLGQSITSAPCRVLLAPRSVEPRTLQRVAALREAYQQAQEVPNSPDVAGLLLKSLLRVLTLSDTPPAANFTSELVDQTQQLVSKYVWQFEGGGRSLTDEQKRISDALIRDTELYWKGEQARVVLAEMENLEVAGAKRKDLSKQEGEALRMSIQRAKKEWSASVRELSIDPRAGDARARLESLVRSLDERLKNAHPADAHALAEEWSKKAPPANDPAGDNATADAASDANPDKAKAAGEASDPQTKQRREDEERARQQRRSARDRMAMAAQTQVLRGDGDLAWARDLQLAARAMTRLDEPPAADEGAAADKPDLSKDQTPKKDTAADASPPADPDAGKPDAGKPDAGKPDAGKPDAGKSDAAKSDAAKSDTFKSDAKPAHARAPEATASAAVDPAKAVQERRQLAEIVRTLQDARRESARAESNIANSPDGASAKAAKEARDAAATAAEAARKQLRQLAGELPTDATPADKALDRALAGADAVADKKFDDADELDAMPDDDSVTGDTPDGPEKWQPPADGKGDPSAPAGKRNKPTAAGKSTTAARELNDVSQKQSEVAGRTDAAASQEQAQALEREQQAIAERIDALRQKQAEAEGFFKPAPASREETLEAIRAAQQTLTSLPQQIGEIRKMSEDIRQLKGMLSAAQDAARDATPDARNAADRGLAEAKRQMDQALKRLNDAAAPMFAGAMKSLQNSSGKIGASDAQRSGGQQGGGRSNGDQPGGPAPAGAGDPGRSQTITPLGPTLNENLAPALASLQQKLAAGDAAAAEASANQAFDAIAQLQASLRVAARRETRRDPLVSAKFYADQAAAALAQRPPDFATAREAQRHTREALGQAWDDTLTRGLRARLQQVPGLQSLLSIDLPADERGGAGDGGAVKPSKMPLLREWGRLRQQSDAQATAADSADVAEGYEEPLKIYFEQLDAARSDKGER